MNLEMDNAIFNCPICGKPIVMEDRSEGGGLAILSRFIKIDPETKTSTCKCRKCGNIVESPFRFKSRVIHNRTGRNANRFVRNAV